jgi:2-methylisocitrate lyase-like PEP mutase family enzyme
VTDQHERAETLRALHRPGDPVVLVNVWDAAGARTVADAGSPAVATASWSIAAAHGYPDGEAIPLELMLAAIARIVDAVDVPVTADIESGFGESPGDVSETVARVLDAGAVGVNLEDRLRPAAEHVAIVEAVRARGERDGVPLVINARSDEFLKGEKRFDELTARGRAYLDAGADCFFAPGLGDLERIRELTATLDAPVNVLPGAASPPLGELAAAGVARVSFGPGPMGVAYAALRDATEVLLARGAYPATLAHRPAGPS